MFHGNAVRIEKGMVYADRKFFNGMRLYVENIKTPLTSVHPKLGITEEVMDGIEIPVSELGFSIIAIDSNEDSKKIDKELNVVIGNSSLVYGNTYWSNTRICKKLNIPYVLFLETDIRTQISVNTLHLPNLFRRVARTIRIIIQHCTVEIPAIRSARVLHCNGYPVYNETRALNKSQLLYFDSRMSLEQIIPKDKLELRMESRGNRRIKLLFSGRYEKIKGALDCVKVAVECIRRNLNIELHCFGQGRLREDMLREVQLANASDRIFIHDSIPYPELVQRSYEFDIFICCHVQSDPSCTYLEAFGAGLPIVGYANRMWQHLSLASKVGFATKIHRPELVADSISKLIANPVCLDSMTHLAREFAMAHTFEHEFSLRTDSLRKALSE